MFNFKFKNKKKLFFQQEGMTYIELIVVLSIFAIMSSIVMFNYGSFQSNINIKNLSSDIALKLVQTQKYSVFGKLPPLVQQGLIESITTLDKWKPSYGIYFNMSDNKNFVYFTDIDSNKVCDGTCENFLTNGEFLEKISINKGNFIKSIDFMDSNKVACSPTISKLNIVFKRPSSDALITAIPSPPLCVMSYVQITISSSSAKPVTSKILVYPSGRMQIN